MDYKAAALPNYQSYKVSEDSTLGLRDLNDCYRGDNFEAPSRCFQKTKTEYWSGCTYKDPTDFGTNFSYSSDQGRIGLTNFPVSTHIHGLEVRPYFDGNPLSWFSHRHRGVGYMSAEQRYFHLFTKFER